METTELKVEKAELQRVVVSDIDIKFWSMVQLMVKGAFAAVPAMIIVVILVWGILAVFGGMFGIFR